MTTSPLFPLIFFCSFEYFTDGQKIEAIFCTKSQLFFKKKGSHFVETASTEHPGDRSISIQGGPLMLHVLMDGRRWSWFQGNSF